MAFRAPGGGAWPHGHHVAGGGQKCLCGGNMACDWRIMRNFERVADFGGHP